MAIGSVRVAIPPAGGVVGIQSTMGGTTVVLSGRLLLTGYLSSFELLQIA